MEVHVRPLFSLLAGSVAVVLLTTPGRAQRPSWIPGDTVRAAVLEDWPPHYRFQDDGTPTGFAVDVMEEVAARVGLDKDGCICLEGAGCPLGSVVREHPETCVLAAALVSEIVGRPVREECDRAGDVPRCRFEVNTDESEGARETVEARGDGPE